MKEGAVFINTAREILVDEQALYRALVSKHLAGAALDVLKPWPADTPGPLVSLPNVIITPHIGGAPHQTAFRRGKKLFAPEAAVLTRPPMPPVFDPAPTRQSRRA